MSHMAFHQCNCIHMPANFLAQASPRGTASACLPQSPQHILCSPTVPSLQEMPLRSLLVAQYQVAHQSTLCLPRQRSKMMHMRKEREITSIKTHFLVAVLSTIVILS